jgi:hypothetical protein
MVSRNVEARGANIRSVPSTEKVLEQVQALRD